MKLLTLVFFSVILTGLVAHAELYWDFNGIPLDPIGLPVGWQGIGWSVRNGVLINDTPASAHNPGSVQTPPFRFASGNASAGTAPHSAAGGSGGGASGESMTISMGTYRCATGFTDGCEIDLLRLDQHSTIADALFVSSEVPFNNNLAKTEEYPVIDAGGIYSIRFSTYDYNDPTILSSLSNLRITNADLIHEDFNHNGIIDAADYTVWRDHLFDEGAPYIAGDADGNGIVNISDYQIWKNHFAGGAAIGAAAIALDQSSHSTANAPEPASFALVACGLLALVTRYARRVSRIMVKL
jgi:hypothetical protein